MSFVDSFPFLSRVLIVRLCTQKFEPSGTKVPLNTKMCNKQREGKKKEVFLF